MVDALRRRQSAAGTAWAVLTAVCMAATIGAVIVGLVVMTSKS
jgi:hypothetical protein